MRHFQIIITNKDQDEIINQIYAIIKFKYVYWKSFSLSQTRRAESAIQPRSLGSESLGLTTFEDRDSLWGCRKFIAARRDR